ncbi:MAG: 3-oxoacyl-[acyl-carrier-protein] reductase [Clostridia bacterium]|nr:3-oxoacyl-[acyl-carrier-protein] reductase [Clostridia bacterium]
MKMNKVALITGGTRGIGKEIAYTLAEENYDIIINYRTENEELMKLKKEIEQKRVRCLLLKGDVSNFEDCKKLVEEAINRMNHIDVLVNNAGITKDMLLMRMKPEDFNEVINVNLIGTFNMTKNVINYMMKERKGRIINISSVVGISGNAGQTNYAASKAGIIGFTKSLAKEVASRNILVNAIAPGFIQTDMTNILKENVKDEIAKTIPLKRMGTAKDVANVVKFLVSEDSSYITGQVIQVDGGMLM